VSHVETKSSLARIACPRDPQGLSCLRNRFPSREDSLYVFAVCALPVFAWAIFSYLYAFPEFVLRMSIWDLVGTASYTLAYALLESLVITVPLILMAAILPARFFKHHFVAFSSVIVIVSSIWIMYANYHLIDFSDWDLSEILRVLLIYLLSLAIPIALILRYNRIEQIVQAIVQRVAVLVYIYAGLACIGFIIILARNL
jgi:hypothetical protein